MRGMTTIEVICGPMFSGKSEELIRRLKRIEIAKKKVIAFKPVIDTRYTADNIVSHTGAMFRALPVTMARDVLAVVEREKPDVVGIDEVQFFDPSVVTLIEDICRR